MINMIMVIFKTKMGARGQIVIPKVIRDNLGMNVNKTIFLEVDNKDVKIISSDKTDIVSSWKEISQKEGCNVSKKLIYGDNLYEEVFVK